MDADVARTLQIVGYSLGLVLISIVLGRLLIGPLLSFLSHRYQVSSRGKDYSGLAAWIGAIEQPMYTFSILLGRPEFIGVWLVLKTVGEWKPNAEDNQIMGMSKRYMIFLIGNALSLSLGVGTALLIRQFVPALPDLHN